MQNELSADQLLGAEGPHGAASFQLLLLLRCRADQHCEQAGGPHGAASFQLLLLLRCRADQHCEAAAAPARQVLPGLQA